MRDFLNDILAFIMAESLTDIEFNSLPIDSAAYNQETYDALAAVLLSRESVSVMQKRLIDYFSIKGVDVAPVKVANSEILIGLVL